MKFEWQKRGMVHVHMLIWSMLGVDIKMLLQTPEGLLILAKIMDIYITTLFSKESAPFVPSNNIKSNEKQSEQEEFYSSSTLKNQTSDSNSTDTTQPPTIECFQEHPSSFFSPLLLLLHKKTQDYLDHLLYRLQEHDCALYKKGKKCGFPKDLVGNTYLENKHTNTKTRMHVHTTRGHLYFNNYNQTITINWAANTDIQLCGNPFGAT
jgi:hypothetical protein